MVKVSFCISLGTRLLWIPVVSIFFTFLPMGTLPAFGEDSLQRVIDLVIENHPLLTSQRSLMEEIKNLPQPRGLDTELKLTASAGTEQDEETGEIVPAYYGRLELEIPLYASSRSRDKAKETLTTFKEYEKARQSYFQMKSAIISDLLNKVTQLSGLDNEQDNLEELKTLLARNALVLEQEIQAGLADFSDLWDIRERLMETKTRLQNISTKLRSLKREIALNFGGVKWEELLEILDGLEE